MWEWGINPRGREIHHMHDGHTRHTSVPTWYYHFFSLVTGWLWSRSFCVQARSTTDVRANTCHQIDNIFGNALLSVASLPCLGIMECASAVTGSLSGSRQRSLSIPSVKKKKNSYMPRAMHDVTVTINFAMDFGMNSKSWLGFQRVRPNRIKELSFEINHRAQQLHSKRYWLNEIWCFKGSTSSTSRFFISPSRNSKNTL